MPVRCYAVAYVFLLSFCRYYHDADADANMPPPLARHACCSLLAFADIAAYFASARFRCRHAVAYAMPFDTLSALRRHDAAMPLMLMRVTARR